MLANFLIHFINFCSRFFKRELFTELREYQTAISPVAFILSCSSSERNFPVIGYLFKFKLDLHILM